MVLFGWFSLAGWLGPDGQGLRSPVTAPMSVDLGHLVPFGEQSPRMPRGEIVVQTKVLESFGAGFMSDWEQHHNETGTTFNPFGSGFGAGLATQQDAATPIKTSAAEVIKEQGHVSPIIIPSVLPSPVLDGFGSGGGPGIAHITTHTQTPSMRSYLAIMAILGAVLVFFWKRCRSLAVKSPKGSDPLGYLFQARYLEVR